MAEPLDLSKLEARDTQAHEYALEKERFYKITRAMHLGGIASAGAGIALFFEGRRILGIALGVAGVVVAWGADDQDGFIAFDRQNAWDKADAAQYDLLTAKHGLAPTIHPGGGSVA